MKYLITESQLNKIIFDYLNGQDFIQIDKDDRIYFLNSEGDEYTQIRYDKVNGWCYIKESLIKEISSFFSLQQSDSKQVISRWVENTLQMEVTHTWIPQIPFPGIVENTPQLIFTQKQITL